MKAAGVAPGASILILASRKLGKQAIVTGKCSTALNLNGGIRAILEIPRNFPFARYIS